jgi:hypothetical protein
MMNRKNIWAYSCGSGYPLQVHATSFLVAPGFQLLSLTQASVDLLKFGN